MELHDQSQSVKLILRGPLVQFLYNRPVLARNVTLVTIGLWMGVKLLGNSTGIVFETVERHLSILADLDEVAVGITHVAAPFPAVIV